MKIRSISINTLYLQSQSSLYPESGEIIYKVFMFPGYLLICSFVVP